MFIEMEKMTMKAIVAYECMERRRVLGVISLDSVEYGSSHSKILMLIPYEREERENHKDIIFKWIGSMSTSMGHAISL